MAEDQVTDAELLCDAADNFGRLAKRVLGAGRNRLMHDRDVRALGEVRRTKQGRTAEAHSATSVLHAATIAALGHPRPVECHADDGRSTLHNGHPPQRIVGEPGRCQLPLKPAGDCLPFSMGLQNRPGVSLDVLLSVGIEVESDAA